MTENEAKAVRFIENIKNHATVTLDHIAKEEPNVSPLVYKGREEKADTILAMVEELQQYRAIGTVEGLKSLKENGAFTGEELAQLAAMQMWLRDYEKIGTVEECRSAMDKQTAVPREIIEGEYFCPKCHNLIHYRGDCGGGVILV